MSRMSRSDQRKGPEGRPYRGASEEQRRSERRARLIQAGITVFGRGYHAATVKSVCAEAGLTERYFYQSFANREALLLAAYMEVTTHLRIRVEAALAVATQAPEARIRAALQAYFTAVREQPAAARLMLVEVLGVSEQVDRAYRRALGDFGALVQGAQRTVLAAPEGLDEDLLATALVGAVVQLAQYWLLSGYARPLAAVLDTSHAIFVAVARNRRGDR